MVSIKELYYDAQPTKSQKQNLYFCFSHNTKLMSFLHIQNRQWHVLYSLVRVLWWYAGPEVCKRLNCGGKLRWNASTRKLSRWSRSPGLNPRVCNNVRFSLWYRWGFKSAGMTHCIVRWVVPDTLTLILPMWRIWWAPNNASRWQIGFNWAFKGLRITMSSFQGSVSTVSDGVTVQKKK